MTVASMPGRTADVGLVDEGAGADLGEVGHLHDGRAAAGRAGAGLDDLTERDRLLDDGAEDRRGDARVVEALLREVERGARAHDRRRGVRVVEVRRLVLLRGDDLPREEVVGALLLELGDLNRFSAASRSALAWSYWFCTSRVSSWTMRSPGRTRRAGLDRHLGDLSRRAGLHFDDVDRFDDAGGLGLHDDRAALDGRGADGEGLLLLAGTVDRRGDERARARSVRNLRVTAGTPVGCVWAVLRVGRRNGPNV
jgi:hypothetical protein